MGFFLRRRCLGEDFAGCRRNSSTFKVFICHIKGGLCSALDVLRLIWWWCWYATLVFVYAKSDTPVQYLCVKNLCTKFQNCIIKRPKVKAHYVTWLCVQKRAHHSRWFAVTPRKAWLLCHTLIYIYKNETRFPLSRHNMKTAWPIRIIIFFVVFVTIGTGF